jgi:tRNA threonylcarbamoyladenosine biosynthesis protein TsaE
MQRKFILKEIDEVANQILAHPALSSPQVLALYGQMGAGKTTFSAALMRALGSTDMVHSPTFSIINQYTDKKGNPIFHMDWYRLRDEEEAMQAGVEDPMYSGHWCVIEWPEKAETLLPPDSVRLQINLNPDGSRTIFMLS